MKLNLGRSLLISVLGCLTLTVLGILVSVTCEDGMFLARFGSLIVVFGVILTWKDLSENARNRKLIIEAWLPDYVKGRHQNEMVEKRKKELTEPLEREINILQAVDIVVIIYGTLLWGWGDLLIN